MSLSLFLSLALSLSEGTLASEHHGGDHREKHGREFITEREIRSEKRKCNMECSDSGVEESGMHSSTHGGCEFNPELDASYFIDDGGSPG